MGPIRWQPPRRYRRLALIAVAGLLLLTTGCMSRPLSANSPDTIIVVHGSDGDGPWYAGLMNGLRQRNDHDHIQMLTWGVPLPLFMLNARSSLIHDAAERKLVRQITAWRKRFPQGRIRLVAHSAGGGVVLGALERLEAPVQVQQVVLLAPAVSPHYNLAPALAHVQDQLHLFYSSEDSFILGSCNTLLGTYDRKLTAAAGKAGFQNLDELPPDLRHKVTMHPYDPTWRRLGHDGGHFGPRSRPFAATILSPLLAEPKPMPVPDRALAQQPRRPPLVVSSVQD